MHSASAHTGTPPGGLPGPRRNAARPIPTDPAAALTADEVALLTGLTARGLEGLRQRGGGPSYFLAGKRAIRYRRVELERWIAERTRTSTSGGAHE